MDDRTEAQKQAQRDQWDYNLTTHTIHPNAVGRIEGLRSAAKAMAHAIIDMVPAGREQSLALTHCESMLQAAVGGIARYETMDNPKFAAERAQDAPSSSTGQSEANPSVE